MVHPRRFTPLSAPEQDRTSGIYSGTRRHASIPQRSCRVDRFASGAKRSAIEPSTLRLYASTLLDDTGNSYDHKADLPKLWKLCADELNLSPSQHSEEVFKTILGNCQSVVNSLGAVRNRIGDAHGQGRRPVRPKPRHAELADRSLAGTMAAFLVATWQDRKNSASGGPLRLRHGVKHFAFGTGRRSRLLCLQSRKSSRFNARRRNSMDAIGSSTRLQLRIEEAWVRNRAKMSTICLKLRNGCQMVPRVRVLTDHFVWSTRGLWLAEYDVGIETYGGIRFRCHANRQ